MKRLVGQYAQRMTSRQSYAGGRVELIGVIDATSSGSMMAPRTCIALIWAWGGGASGFGNTGAQGGGGAGGVFKFFRISKGQTISYTVGAGGAGTTNHLAGNDGGNSTVTLPNGLVLTAGGGKGNGTGGTASGGDLNRPGGAGGLGAAGATGANGALGGAVDSGAGGGGGAGGFTDRTVGMTGGAGSAGASGGPSAAGAVGGGGSGSSTISSGTSGAGGAGRVLIHFVKAI